ncbi:type II toxin-antitoxin system HicA family toxin [Imperialibacter roseus]|uniref:type II toxin-antitoxin system HicA family toxin n=1 Tax=Imperialibacter roseus TaxID=1324217 RepID=UPI00374E9E52
MSKLPIINSTTFELLLLSLGFEIKRQKGRHVFYRHPDGRYTTLPRHKSTDRHQPVFN